jgi:tRNA-specific adenosine deaminase 3
VERGEELCIFYGHRLWFELEGLDAPGPFDPSDDGPSLLENELDALPHMNDEEWSEEDEPENLYDGKPTDILTEDELPFERIKTIPDEIEEETLESIQTGKAL